MTRTAMVHLLSTVYGIPSRASARCSLRGSDYTSRSNSAQRASSITRRKPSGLHARCSNGFPRALINGVRYPH
jgi:hypothetical protein